MNMLKAIKIRIILAPISIYKMVLLGIMNGLVRNDLHQKKNVHQEIMQPTYIKAVKFVIL